MFTKNTNKIYILKSINYIFSLLFDSKCEICKGSHYQRICPNCLSSKSPIVADINEKINDVRTISAFYYESIIRKSLLLLKFNNKKLISQDLSILLSKYWINNPLSKRKYLVIPIPISSSKHKQRGYNQAALIARYISFFHGYQYSDKILIRTIDTIDQHKLSTGERLTNLSGAFLVQQKPSDNTPILIIEDIITTGSTIMEATKVLKQAGYKDITVLSLARTKLDKKKATTKRSCSKQLDNSSVIEKLENFSEIN